MVFSAKGVGAIKAQRYAAVFLIVDVSSISSIITPLIPVNGGYLSVLLRTLLLSFNLNVMPNVA